MKPDQAPFAIPDSILVNRAARSRKGALKDKPIDSTLLAHVDDVRVVLDEPVDFAVDGNFVRFRFGAVTGTIWPAGAKQLASALWDVMRRGLSESGKTLADDGGCVPRLEEEREELGTFGTFAIEKKGETFRLILRGDERPVAVVVQDMDEAAFVTLYARYERAFRDLPPDAEEKTIVPLDALFDDEETKEPA